MAQSKTVAAALFIVAFVAAAASVASASASEAAAARKLLAGDGMIPVTSDDLIPASGANSLTTGRAGVVAIQRQLLTNDWFDKEDIDNGRSGVASIQSQRELLADDWFPRGGADVGRSGVAGIQSQRQLIATIPITAENLLHAEAAKALTKGKAGVIGIQKEITGTKVPAA